MRKFMLFLMASGTLVLCSCNRTSEEPVMKVYHGGNEYSVLERGDMEDQGLPAYFVRYFSAGPKDDGVVSAEQTDLSAIVAKHIDTNAHRRVVFVAVGEKGRLFGLMKPAVSTRSVSVEEVMKHKPEE